MQTLIRILLILTLNVAAHAADQQVTLAVPGMNCTTCPITVKIALQRVKGVGQVAVSMETQQAVVQFDDVHAQVADLIAATTNAGYPASQVTTTDAGATIHD